MNVLSVQNLGKSFRKYQSELRRIFSWFGVPAGQVEEHWVLKDVSFSLGKGESLALVGQNGAGKSTLLKLISGVQKPTEGTIFVNGRISAILELGLGFNLEFTGFQNAAHGLGLWGYSHKEIADVLPKVNAFAEIGEYFDYAVRTYSSGMQMRLAFAVATAFRPDILIVDEALSVGDSYFQAKCYKRISEFVEQGTSLLLVTHSMSDVLKHCDRAIYIENGRMMVDGLPKDVTNRYLDRLSKLKTNHQENLRASVSRQPSKTVDDDTYATRPGYRKEEYRWDAIGAKIIDFEISNNGSFYPRCVESNTNLDIRFKVFFEETFENVVPGILIKTVDGVFVYGANSIGSNNNSDAVRASQGQTKCFRFIVNFSLAQGAYLLSLGVSAGTDTRELVPLDRRYDSILITVSRTVGLTGIVDLKAGFSVESGFSLDE